MLKFSQNVQAERVFFARVVVPVKLKPSFRRGHQKKKEGPASQTYLKMVYSTSPHSLHSFPDGTDDLETGNVFTIFENTPFRCS